MLFNGRSIFRDRDIQAIIFDDAHVANNFVRSNFVLKISSDHPAYKPIANLFRSYFARNSQGQELDDAISGDWRALLFVPTFEVAQKASQLRLALTESGVDKDNELGFPWIYLKDRLARCAVIISGSAIEISPPLLPVHTLHYFGKGVRRLYLTCDLGKLLGFDASRPDHDSGTGPDVLWRSPSHKAGVALEAKTNKGATSQYQKKDDIGQFHDHAEWLKKSWPQDTFYKIIVGRKLTVSKDANPPVDLRIVPLDQFIGLASRLEELIQFVDSAARSEEMDVVIERAMRYLGLTWPNCIDSLESSLAIDLKQPEQMEIAL